MKFGIFFTFVCFVWQRVIYYLFRKKKKHNNNAYCAKWKKYVQKNNSRNENIPFSCVTVVVYASAFAISNKTHTFTLKDMEKLVLSLASSDENGQTRRCK